MATDKRVTLLEIDIDTTAVAKKQGDLLKQIQKLKDENKVIEQLTGKLTKANEKQAQSYAKNQAEIKKLQQDSRTYNKILQDQTRSGDANVTVIKKTDGSLNSLRNALNVNKTLWKSLTKEERENSQAGKELTKIINEQDKEYKELSRSIGNNQVDVGNYGRALDGLGGKIKALLSVGAIIGLIKGISALQKEMREATRTANTLFDGTKEEIKAITIEARALSNAFDLDVNETLKTANVLSKQFGVSAVESLSLIEDGISKGANANGEFLDNLKEYSTQFRLAGLTAEESISIITQQVKEGVFSDKGVDSIKEATIRLRELTPATRDALKSIGISSEQVQKDISIGAKTYFDVIQEVSSKTKEFGEDSQQAGQILADVFGGAGEDAGDFIFKLGEINTKLSEQASVLTEADEAQIALDKSWSKFTSNVASGENIIGKAFTKIKQGIAFVLDDFERASRQISSGFAFSPIQFAKNEALIKTSNDIAKKQIDKFNSEVLQKSIETNKSREELTNDFINSNSRKLKILEEAEKSSLEERVVLSKKYNIDLQLLQGDELKAYKQVLTERNNLLSNSLNEEVKIEETKNKNIGGLTKTRLKQDLEVYKQNLDQQLESIKSNAELEVEVRQATSEQLKNIALKDKEFIDNLRTTTFAKNLQKLQLEGATELELKLAQLRLEKEQEVQLAEETGADVAKVNKKYADIELKTRQEIELQKVQTISSALSAVLGLLDEQGGAYKALAITQALIDTYIGAQKAYLSQLIPGDPTSLVRAQISAGIATVVGLGNVAKISGFADGTDNAQPYGVVDLSSHTGTIAGTPNISRSNGDNMLATVKTGEAILNKEQQNRINSWLGFNGISKAVRGYADGTTFTSPSVQNSINRNVVNNTVLSGNDLGSNIELVVDVKDIVKATGELNTKVQDATI